MDEAVDCRGAPRLALFATVAILLGGAPLDAQEAYTYTVRDGGGGYGIGAGAGDAVPELDLYDGRAVRVVQGPELTWVVEEGDPFTVRDAEFVLHHNVPVMEGSGALLLRGWRPARIERYDTFAVSLTRGGRDRDVAGRTAHHYVMRALVERVGPYDEAGQRFRLEGHFWIIPEVPFTWAPFGLGARSLPILLPRLRDELEPRLGELGLVARAVTRTEFTMLRDGLAPAGSEQVSGFEIFGLERTHAPPAPGPIVDRSIVDAAQRLAVSHPGRVCEGAADGELPAIMRARIDEDLWGPLIGFIDSACGSLPLYLAILEARFDGDEEGLCRAVRESRSPNHLARAVYDDEQRAAFMQRLGPDARREFLERLRGLCSDRREPEPQ